MERLAREGGDSPSRLTMAQAALLNLQGNQLHSQSPDQTALLANARLPDSVGVTANSALFGGAYAANVGVPVSPLPPARVLQHQQQALARPQMPIGLQDALASVDVYGSAYDDFGVGEAQYLGEALRAPAYMLQDDAALYNAQSQLPLGAGVGMGMNVSAGIGVGVGAQSSAARAENGFTPMERMILQAHAQRQQVQPASAQNELPVRSSASASALAMQGPSRGLAGSIHAPPALSTGKALPDASGRDANRRLLDALAPMSEDDFHASGGGGRPKQRQPYADFSDFADFAAVHERANRRALGQASSLALDLDLDRTFSLAYQQRQRNQTHVAHTRGEAEAEAHAHAQALHARATTLPSQYLGAQTLAGGSAYHGGGIDPSILNNSTNSNRVGGTNGGAHFGLGGLSSINSLNSLNSINNLNSLNSISSISNPKHSPYSTQKTLRPGAFGSTRDSSNIIPSNTTGSIFSNNHGTNMDRTGVHGKQHRGAHDADEEDRSPLVSPALTYSARTPVSLSPSTPFSGFFPHPSEAFDGPAMGAGVGEAHLEMGEKLKAGAGSR